MTRLRDHQPTQAALAEQALEGLLHPPRTLPCKFFYDRRGAELFERICELPEYYLTRTELGILDGHLDEMAACLGPGCLVLELGSGAGQKTRMLLDHLQEPVAYVPVDISRHQLIEVAEALARAYPGLEVLPVCADYTAGELRLPEPRRPAARRMFFFPGSTIGNFHPHEAAAFLARIAGLLGPGAALLVGVDLRKDPRVLEAAYNDAAGVTAEFNLNLLYRLNRECGATFDLDGFRHHAPYDEERGRIEMQLISTRAQTARLLGRTLSFAAGEIIVTEHCYKYTLPGFARLAARAGLAVSSVWCDAEERFSVQLLEPAR
jgi:L-histidine N-alpha-methyltransferase